MGWSILAQKLFWKPIQDTLPAHNSAFNQPRVEYSVTPPTTSIITTSMHTHSLKSMLAPMLRLCVAIQNPLNKQWDTYRVIIKIGPYRQYHIKLMNGRVLVRNCRFIRCRVPVTLSRPSGACPFSV